MFEVEIAGAVRAINRAIDDAHVAFALGWARTRAWTWTRTWLSFTFFCLRQFFRGGAVIESDHLSVRRPLRAAGAARQSRELKRLATGHCQHEQLCRLGAATDLWSTHGDEIFS